MRTRQNDAKLLWQAGLRNLRLSAPRKYWTAAATEVCRGRSELSGFTCMSQDFNTFAGERDGRCDF